MNIQERLTKVFRAVFDNESITLTPDLTADDIDEWDSLSHINLMLAIELEFGIEFLQSEIQDFRNVGELIECVKTKLEPS
ncbi:MAG TPA: acyl carrier protein [Anaerolineaceae bacterium]|nr:acyl carrier protein [Anaerolineaceae bacterium]HOS53675.1 acyl carrier protein [Anaerolineaceae bacterium]HPD62325.1 acyl carrier protein [Anaerolineaceae bacterium]HQK05002.1 acyl carrier protein [Anaerolineaceae bacterium]HRT91625.1 acyl carrier protein [Anaerolineaceae bacterium]